MKSDNHTPSPWTLRGTSASMAIAKWSGKLDLEQPNRGLDLHCGTESSGAGLLGVDFSLPHHPFDKDCYVRQGDLIVVYPQRDDRKFSLQLDYRLLEAGPDRLLIELWISVQTYLLDSRPTVSVSCRADRESIRTESTISDASHQAVVQGTVDGTLHWAWLTHPRDQDDTSWNWNGDRQAFEAGLFGHFMEKGVIRRARMRCLIGTTSLKEREVDEAYQSFVVSPLPLTA